MVASMSGPRGWGEPTWGQTPSEPTSDVPVDSARPLLGLGELMDRTIATIRWAPGVTWAFGGAIVGVLALVEGGLAAALGLRGYVEALGTEDLTDLDAQLPALAASAVVSVIAWVTGLVATALCAGAAAVVVDRAGGGLSTDDDLRRAPTRPSVAAVWAALRPRAAGAVGLALLLAVAIGALVALPVVWLLAFGAAGAWGVAIGGGVAVAIGVVVLALWLLPVLALALPEHVAPTAALPGGALARSSRLARGARWRLVGVWLLTSIVLALAGGVISGPFGWLSTWLAGVGDGAGTAVAWVVGGAVSAAVTAPIGALVLALVHADLRPRG